MNVNDIIALAHAGFTAQQISAIAQAVPAAPAAPAVAAAAAPAAPAVAAPEAPVAPALAAPATPQPDFFNRLLSKIDGLTTTMQANAILNSQQPAQQSEQDILAEIICPPIRKE